MSFDSRLPGRLGFGSAPLGNMYRAIPEEEAAATVDQAWDGGVRYFDTAPFYGAGLSEIRLGEALSRRPRNEYVLSSKVGRVILPEAEGGSGRDQGETGGIFAHGRPHTMIDDYSADATLRSIEDSLERLQTDRLDIVWVHDIAQDFHGDDWLAVYDSARTGAFRVLTRLREEGVISAWGLGVNRVEPVELALDLEEPQPDAFLLAGRYSLLDHERALTRLLPQAVDQGVAMVVGGPYNSGVLAGGEHFEYAPASEGIRAEVSHIRRIAEEFGVSVKAATLQFSLAHPATAAVIPGATRPERVLEDLAAVDEQIPAEFWTALQQRKMLSPLAPVSAT